MKKDNTKVLSFRFNENIVNKIDFLLYEENKRLASFDTKPITRTELIEEIIKEYYYRYINKSRDPDVIERISLMVDDAVDNKTNNMNKKIDELLYLSIKNDLGNKLIYKSPNIIQPPSSTMDGLKIIVNEESKWDSLLDEYLMDSWKSGRIRSYLRNK